MPLVIILSVSTLWRRLRFWRAAVACVALAFITAWFWNPPYGFSPEDNLAYRDFIVLHQDGERFLEARPALHVLRSQARHLAPDLARERTEVLLPRHDAGRADAIEERAVTLPVPPRILLA